MHHYTPGTQLAVARPRALALLPADTAPDVRAAVHAALETADLGHVIDALAAAFGVSITALPAFGVAIHEEGGTRVAVRGSIVGFAGGPLSGERVTTWSETVVEPGVPVLLGASDGVAPGPESLALGDGMAWVSVIQAGTPTAATAPAPAPQVAAAPPVAAHEPQAPAPEPASPSAPPEGATPDAATPISHTTLTPDLESDDEVPEPAPPAEADEEPLSLDTNFGGLWGATTVDPPAAAATPAPEPAPRAPEPPAPEPPAAEPASDDAPSHEPREVEPEPQQPPPAQQPPAPLATPTSNGMIAGVPDFLAGSGASAAPEPAPEPPAAPQPPPVAPPLGDHDGATITAAQARALAADAGPPAPQRVAPGQAPAVEVGRAVVSTGQEITLDRTVIIGRRPKATRVTGEPPHLVAVPSPQQDISRNHLELRVEGRAVVAVDLNTTNGSLLRRGTADPVRLHPNEPTVIVTGDILDLGDGVTVTCVEIP